MDVKVIATSSTERDKAFSRWGLSLLVDGDILFDAFSDPAVLLANMRRMKIDPEAVRRVVISHDHWGHAGGLPGLLEKNKELIVYGCADFSNELKEKIISSGVSLMEAERFFKIKSNIYTTGAMSGLYEDFFIAEQALVIDRGEALAVLCGCAHPGITAIIKAASHHLNKIVNSIAGGFHLNDKSAEQIRDIAGELEGLGVKKVYSTHCNGEKAEAILREKFTKDLEILKSGDILDF